VSNLGVETKKGYLWSKYTAGRLAGFTGY